MNAYDDEQTRDRILAVLARDIAPELPTDEAAKRLKDALDAIRGEIDSDELDRRLNRLASGREGSTRSAAVEALISLVARAMLARATRAVQEPPPDGAARWIAYNVTSASHHSERAKAIWRVAAGIATERDREIHDHAVRSALAGTSVDPVPGPAPSSAQPGTEVKMLDPTALRDKLLANFTFNPAGLPPTLRSPMGQKVYLDAVIQGVLRQQHFSDGDEDRALFWSASAAGLLLVDGSYNPSDQRFYQHLQRVIVELAGSADEDATVEIDGHKQHMFAPDDQTQRISIFAKTLKLLNGAEGKAIFLQSFARVARQMADRYDDHKGDDIVMGAMVNSAYSTDISDIASGGGGGGRGGGIADLVIPPLSDPQGYNDEIEGPNVIAVSTVYVTYQLEFALKAAARMLDLFVAGLLPIPASDGSARELDNLYWDQDDMLDEASRRSIYSRVLGAPGGEIAFNIQPNTEFNTRLMRVVSAVSEYEREQAALTHFDNAARGRRFQSTSGEFVRKAIRDFAANASLRGWAGTAFTAERMARQVKRVMKVLSLPSVRNAFGVSTPWQVIERISQREFGITVNTVLHRTLAVETQTIMRIIAENHTIWSNNAGRPLFPEPGHDVSDLSPEATRELMVACQHFRAVTGVGDALLDEYSTPVETQPMPSLPDMSGFGGMNGGNGMAGIDIGGLGQLREMVAAGQAPNLEQLRAMLPGL